MEGGADDLTQYATGMRYGEVFRLPSLEETSQAMELAQWVVRFVMSKLLDKGFDVPRIGTNPSQRLMF